MTGRHTVWALLGLALLAVSLHGQVNADTLPSESECRPYIEKAIHELQGDTVDDKTEDTPDPTVSADQPIDDGSSNELQADQPDQTENQTEEESAEGSQDVGATDDGVEKAEGEIDGSVEGDEASTEDEPEAEASTDETENAESGQTEESGEQADQPAVESGEDEEATKQDDEASTDDAENAESGQTEESGEQKEESTEAAVESGEDAKADETSTDEASAEDAPEQKDDADDNDTAEDDGADTNEETDNAESGSVDAGEEASEPEGSNEAAEVDSGEKPEGSTEEPAADEKADTEEDTKEDETDDQASAEEASAVEDEIEAETTNESGRVKREIADDTAEDTTEDTTEESTDEAVAPEADGEGSTEQDGEGSTEKDDKQSVEEVADLDEQIDSAAQNGGSAEDEASAEEKPAEGEAAEEVADEEAESGEKSHPEEDLLLEFEIPENLRDRDHITELLHLDDVSSNTENAIHKTADVILKELKKIYDSAIKPLEVQYKYRDLSNRHFGDPEIFSKPLVLFMGPWSGGKSTILNYLTDNEYTVNSLRTGAEPSPAYFNILMHGDEPEVLDGTQLAADWTFSGLQKFGEGMLDRLRGLRMPNKLLEKVNIVEIPGILEVRKQVSRLFPFNDACQWFIDRADIIFLVYDPAKLDVGPETEAILDQLKGREYQTRIVLNKADTVKPEELMRVQGALIWNISPLMSSAQPPVMYTVSLWSHPFDSNAPVRLLQAQERALLRDLRGAIDKRIENKIASARRFAVRVRNHAKMVDCYLTTYYNHKTLFGNKKQISEQIITNPQNYHIYEGISTLTNISRYDLPDPDVYRDFFRLNPLYEFKKLVETCTYFNGCPINKLDVAIAYDLPELVGKYKKQLDANLAAIDASEAGGAKPKS